MANLRKSKQKEKAERGLSATASVVHPADFPVGSLESRAAARTLLRKLRPGDQGATEDGGWYLCIGPHGHDPRPIVIVFPKSLRDLRSRRSARDDGIGVPN